VILVCWKLIFLTALSSDSSFSMRLENVKCVAEMVQTCRWATEEKADDAALAKDWRTMPQKKADDTALGWELDGSADDAALESRHCCAIGARRLSRRHGAS